MYKKLFFAFAIQFITAVAFAQQQYLPRERIDQMTDSIQKEGKALYRSEWASWYGTDIFMEKYKDKQDLIGGYISYETPTGLNNVFFTKDSAPKAIATISFGNDFNSANYKLDTTARMLNKMEMRYVTIRRKAIERIYADTTFKHYKNANLNPVPMIDGSIKRVYVLTGPTGHGSVLFGNDYILNFDKNDKVSDIRRLHKNLIPVKEKSDSDDPKEAIVTTLHTHLPESGDFMSATDICTLMLYQHLIHGNSILLDQKTTFPFGILKSRNC